MSRLLQMLPYDDPALPDLPHDIKSCDRPLARPTASRLSDVGDTHVRENVCVNPQTRLSSRLISVVINLFSVTMLQEKRKSLSYYN